MVSLALVLAMVALTGGMVIGAGHLLRAHDLQGSVDRAALAAGDVVVGVAGEEPCAVAREILHRSGFSMLSCELTAASARVVGTSRQGGIGMTRRAHAGIVNSGQK